MSMAEADRKGASESTHKKEGCQDRHCAKQRYDCVDPTPGLRSSILRHKA